MHFDQDRALHLLRLGTGLPSAAFRDGQEAAIRHIVEGRGRLLLVQRTGWGKSNVYFIATKLLREAGTGPAFLISPLLALMRNQIAAATRMGVRAVTINSDNTGEWERVEQATQRDEIDILLISPERLANERFRSQILSTIGGRVALLVVDEAHCISDWGHDFRPHYRLVERIARALPQNLRLLATTATANNRVMEDLREVLGPSLNVIRGDLSRPSLAMQTVRLRTQAERLAWLAAQVPALPGSGVIYTLTVRDANQVADWLQSRGLNVAPYTGDTGDARPELEQALLDNSVKALVATTALGMGFDKPDLAFVIHYQAPGSVVAYYQQVGRAGRALELAYCVLLSGEEETEIIDYFIKSAFPTREEASAVLGALNEFPPGLSLYEIMAQVNLSRGRIQKTIDLLSLESPAPLVKQGSKWQLTSAELAESFWQRAERLTTLRREEVRQMQQYVGLKSGHMEFLVRALDDEPALRRAVSRSEQLPATVDAVLVRDAMSFLRGGHLLLDPRRQWPAGGLPAHGVKGIIPVGLRAEQGRTLCSWGDAGWGHLVQSGKYKDARYSDDLVRACVSLVSDWRPEPAPTWVTCIPSLRHADLVPDFAKRLATAIGLPFKSALTRTTMSAEQKLMANSIMQARNVDGSMAVDLAEMHVGPVILVDDMVDSRWTITVAAWLLRSQGCEAVHPLVLADTGLKS